MCSSYGSTLESVLVCRSNVSTKSQTGSKAQALVIHSLSN